jgi:hypothetical protein
MWPFVKTGSVPNFPNTLPKELHMPTTNPSGSQTVTLKQVLDALRQRESRHVAEIESTGSITPELCYLILWEQRGEQYTVLYWNEWYNEKIQREEEFTQHELLEVIWVAVTEE